MYMWCGKNDEDDLCFDDEPLSGLVMTSSPQRCALILFDRVVVFFFLFFWHSSKVPRAHCKSTDVWKTLIDHFTTRDCGGWGGPSDQGVHLCVCVCSEHFLPAKVSIHACV